MSDRNSIINDLTKLNNFLYKREKCNYYLDDNNYEEYISRGLTNLNTINEPRKPEKMVLQKLNKPVFFSTLIIVYFVVLGVSMVFMMAGLRVYFLGFIATTVFLCSLIYGFKLIPSALEEYKNDVKEYIMDLRKNKHSEKYNNDGYPIFQKIYEQEKRIYDAQKEELINKNERIRQNNIENWNRLKTEATSAITSIEESINKYQPSISVNYNRYLPDIIRILENGRADTTKEAINVLEDDLYKERMIREEQERQRQEMEMRQRELEARREHEREMRDIAERQAQAMEQQARDNKERIERERREAERKKRKFDNAQREYESAIYARDHQSEGNRKYNQERADRAMADMLKYK